MDPSELERRPTSLGGYGSIVPYHAPATYDPIYGDEGVRVDLPTEGYESADQILNRLTRAADKLDLDTDPGRLYYSAQCQDFSWYGSGIEDLREDLPSSWKLSQTLQKTLEERHGTELGIHRPCFVILAPIRYGIFWTVLRGFKNSDEDGEGYETVYDTQAGVLMENPVLSWPALEELVESDGPIPLVTTEVEAVSLRGEDRPLEEVIPVNHDRTGDADILAAKNVYKSEKTEGSEQMHEAVERTARLSYRIKGGTIGFEKEREFRAEGMSLLRPEGITLGGWPVVMGAPFCRAISDE